MMTSTDIRQKFLDFFRSKGHEIVPSAPIVIKNDPTLMFTNAGMNQFKDYFLGNKKALYPRVADTQKCLRVSGKHNDLEEVGVDTYHHTMFEMLGNWSFGDYFKKEAIEWSWELLIEVYKIPKDRLYVTIFEGDKKEGLPRDDDSFAEWKRWIKEERIMPFDKKDNFWEMGDTGPCGPCTEIHVDCRTDEERKKVDGKTLVNADHPQVIEIWNNVFIQFNRLKDGTLEPLPAKHVDTGMGFERLVRILQNKTSNYDTDIFSDSITETEKIVGKKYNANAANSPSAGGSWREAVAFRVIADHIRAISFTIADGQLPSNTGAGYVIRRILRRAVRYYYSYMDYKQPLLHQLVIGLSVQFKYVFPELYQQAEFVAKVIKEEEEAFLRTLEKGLLRIEMFMSLEGLAHYEKGKKEAFVLPGKIAFELYDTYGFPIDLTKLIANEKGLLVDEKGFEKEMQQQKSRSRAATAIDTEDWIVLDDYARNEFVGYDSLWSETKVVKYRKVKAKGKEKYQIVLEITPFYAESGGQVGDTGVLIFGDESIDVVDTKKDNDLIIHFTDKLPKEVTGTVIAKVDVAKRKNIALHHSATHLLHSALRKVLGNHVTQKGSLVNDEHLRFDFSHFAKMTDEEIAKVESLVNEKIRENIPVVIKQMSKDEALKLGAMALFGEKYGDTVRVVIIDPNFSVELCGGTHVGATGELGLFKLISETAVAAGVRRVEAICGKQAEDYINEQLTMIREVRESLKNPKDITKVVKDLSEENADLKKKLEKAEAKQLIAIRNELLQKFDIINGVTFIGSIVDVDNADALKKLCFDLKNYLNEYIAVLCAGIGGKPFVAVGISDIVATAKNLDAGKIIKEHIAPMIKGGGGGQKTLATAGGQDSTNLQEVIETVKKLL
jgi:alanyl-tRNA synthetase